MVGREDSKGIKEEMQGRIVILISVLKDPHEPLWVT